MSNKDKEVWMAKQAYIALGNLLTVCAPEGIDAVQWKVLSLQSMTKYLGSAVKV